jgi:hypothetical protein
MVTSIQLLSSLLQLFQQQPALKTECLIGAHLRFLHVIALLPDSFMQQNWDTYGPLYAELLWLCLACCEPGLAGSLASAMKGVAAPAELCSAAGRAKYAFSAKFGLPISGLLLAKVICTKLLRPGSWLGPLPIEVLGWLGSWHELLDSLAAAGALTGRV